MSNQITATGSPTKDDLAQLLAVYVNLPENISVDVVAGRLAVQTDDFPALMLHVCLFSFQQYLCDALKPIDWLLPGEREQLTDDLFSLIATTSGCIAERDVFVLERNGQTTLPLPASLTKGFCRQLRVDERITFRLRANGTQSILLSAIDGVAVCAGSRLWQLRGLSLERRETTCVIEPIFEDGGPVEGLPEGLWRRVDRKCRDLIIKYLMNSKQLRLQTPIVVADFDECVLNAILLNELLNSPSPDMLALFELNGQQITDPIVRSLLTRTRNVCKRNQEIVLERTDETTLDIGGITFVFGQTVELTLDRLRDEVGMDKVAGVGLHVEFESPPELEAVGVDLHRAIPKRISSLNLTRPDENAQRRLIVGTSPGCWVAVDLAANMQPVADDRGNWLVYGVASNPISGMPQRFFVRLDANNNFNMTAREIAQVITDTAAEGFDPRDPSTWSWGALALGGQTLLAADTLARSSADEGEELKKHARSLGRLIGRILDEL